MTTHPNHKTSTTLAILAVMSGVAGCAEPTPVVGKDTKQVSAAGEHDTKAPDVKTPAAQTPAEPGRPPTVTGDFFENIQRMRALRIFELDPLSDRISETSNCYATQTIIGIVCPQDLDKHAEAIAAAEKKLADFTVLAETAAASAGPGGPFGPGTDLTAIKELHLFKVGEFIVDQPESATCYGFCNPTNQAREAQLAAIKEAL